MFCDEPSVKVSVLMGVHNIAGLRLFDRAVGSVLAQTMDDFEFLICDDGSTDRTWELLERIAKQDARVRLLRNTKNEGLAFTLNRCLQAAQGEYVARQDADDISAPERFAVQLAFLEQHPEIAFLGSDVILWDECGAWGKREFPEYPQVRDFLFTMPFVHGALMFRREAVRKAGGYRVARETRRAED